MTHMQLLERVWGQDNSGGPGPVCTYVRWLRRKLGDDPDNSSYIFARRRVGYWMERGRRWTMWERDGAPAPFREGN